MKKIIITIMAAMAIAFGAQAQDSNKQVVREGNTFSMVTSKSNKGNGDLKANATLTQYTWKDSKGNTYPVYVSKNGKYFVIRTSQKTGNEYRQYLPKEVQEQMAAGK